MTKTDQEIRDKLDEILALDATAPPEYGKIFSKAAACKTLLWVLGENDDDRWYITAKPGPPLQVPGTTARPS